MDRWTKKWLEVRGKVRERRFRRAGKLWEERRYPVLIARARIAGMSEESLAAYMRLPVERRYQLDRAFAQVLERVEQGMGAGVYRYPWEIWYA